jgi:pilus assembly protein CpaE
MSQRIIDSESMPDDLQFAHRADQESWPSNGVHMQNASTVILVSPDDTRRRTMARSIAAQGGKVLDEFNTYPDQGRLVPLLETDCDAYVVEIDADMDLALELVETICTRKPSATVMVYSENQDPQRVMACMRAGAREFLVAGMEPAVLRDALVRAAVRHVERGSKKALGNILVFWGAKGGSGVTTLATNFAIALRGEVQSEVVLLDLNPALGDAALLLGVAPRFTVADALASPRRVDQEFVASLITKHDSGISVIAAPDTYTPNGAIDGRAVGRLLDTLRSTYSYIVVDAGPGLGAGAETLFQMAGTIYLVAQLDIVSLRNAQRLLTHIRAHSDTKVELVVNRWEPKRIEFDDDRITKALGIAPSWRVPNDYECVHRAANTGSPLMSKRTGVAQTLRSMAQVACGKTGETQRRRGWSIFG